MADSLKFVADCEPWTVYTLEDGTVLKLRLILSKCIRDGNNEDGSPRYLNRFQIIQECEFPDRSDIAEAIKGAAKRGGT